MTPSTQLETATTLVVGRYRLDDLISSGEGGQVYRACDLVADRVVAVKLLPANCNAPRFRAEVAALRLLRLPGVAELYDEGDHEGRPFMAMEWIDGLPFPGRPVTGWQQLWKPSLSLLEILARVHDRGVVHRDLKPDNVLVDESGRPTVLDFGLSTGPALGAGTEQTAGAVGTLMYAAPEQLIGGRTDARADLFAFGAMLYEALVGFAPHADLPSDEFIGARLERSAAPLLERAPDVPPRVAEWIDRLLAVDPRERPRSAAAALRSLSGALAGDDSLQLPWLGPEVPISAALDLLEEGRTVAILGPAGSGKTRVLECVAARLEARGRQLLRLVPSREPLASLVALLKPDESSAASLKEALLVAKQALRTASAEGSVFLADGWSGLDRWTQAVLVECFGQPSEATPGGLLLTADPAALEAGLGAATVELGALGESDLAALFAGPERIFHLPADGARELWRRTDGNPARVVAELASWERAGLVRWSAAHLVIDRTALGRLSLGLAVTPDDRVEQRCVSGMDARAEELLAWVALGRGRAHASWIAQALERPVWRVEAELEELAEAGALAIRPDGSLVAHYVTHALDDWSPVQRARAHARLARNLRPGARGRLLHLILGGRPGEVPDEACRRARGLAAGGQLSEAEAVLTVGLGVARQLELGKHVSCILDEWCAVALADFTPATIDRVLFELAREGRRVERASSALGQHLEHLVALLEAAHATLSGAQRALDQVEAVAPFDFLELERWRQALRTQAARHADPRREAEVVEDIARQWGRHPSALVQASLHEWRGRLAYRLEDYEGAAALFEAAALRGPRASLRLSAMLNGASALLEIGAFDRAEEVGRAARELASDCRHLLFEVRAEWILRAARYRRGEAELPDLELVDAASRVGVLDQEALIALNEAAVAWRAGHPSAAGLAGRAGSLWAAQGKLFGAALGRALQLAASASDLVDRAVPRVLFSEAEACNDLPIRGQIQALLVMAGAPPGDGGRLTALELERALEGKDLAVRLDVLSPREIIAALRSPD